jgi:hypothetical protein
MIMALPDTADALAPELRDTFEMIRATFPHGIPDDAYRPLLALLYEGMSFRTVAKVIEYCTGRPYELVYHDVIAAISPSAPAPLSPEQIENVREQLREHGYDAWLAKAE